MVLSVPLGQVVEVVANGVIRAYLFRLHKVLNVRLRIAALAHILALGSDDDAFQGTLRQRTPCCIVVGNCFIYSRLGYKLHLPVQLIETEKVVLLKERLDYEHSGL